MRVYCKVDGQFLHFVDKVRRQLVEASNYNGAPCSSGAARVSPKKNRVAPLDKCLNSRCTIHMQMCCWTASVYFITVI